MVFKQNSRLYTGILAGISALPPLCIDMNLPAIPDIERAFGAAQGQGSLTLSLFLLGFSVAPIIGGPLTDRFGRRSSLLAALLLLTLAALACVLAPSLHLLLAARLAQGVGCGVCVLVPLAILRDTQTGEAARRKLSVIMLVGGVAPLAAPILGGGILLFSGWRVIYAAQAVLGLALLCLVFLGVAETLAPANRSTINPRTIAANYRTIFGSRRFLAPALTQALCFGCMFSYISGSPSFMLGELGLSEQRYSLAFACTSVGVMAGAGLSGVLGHWEVPSRRIISLGLGGMCAVSLAVFALVWLGVTGCAVLIPALFFLMMSFGVIPPNSMNEAVAPFPRAAGAASGAINSLQMLVGALASALVPLLAKSLAPGQAMAASMLGAIALAACSWLSLRPRRA